MIFFFTPFQLCEFLFYSLALLCAPTFAVALLLLPEIKSLPYILPASSLGGLEG